MHIPRFVVSYFLSRFLSFVVFLIVFLLSFLSGAFCQSRLTAYTLAVLIGLGWARFRLVEVVYHLGRCRPSGPPSPGPGRHLAAVGSTALIVFDQYLSFLAWRADSPSAGSWGWRPDDFFLTLTLPEADIRYLFCIFIGISRAISAVRRACSWWWWDPAVVIHSGFSSSSTPAVASSSHSTDSAASCDMGGLADAAFLLVHA